MLQDDTGNARKGFLAMIPEGYPLVSLKGSLAATHLFAYSKDMSHAGTEIFGLGAIRCTMEKYAKRFVACTPFLPLAAWFQKRHGTQPLPSIQTANNFIWDASQEDIDQMAENGIIWEWAILEELSAVCVPPCYCMVEKPLSGVVCGAHVSWMPAGCEKSVKEYKALADHTAKTAITDSQSVKATMACMQWAIQAASATLDSSVREADKPIKDAVPKNKETPTGGEGNNPEGQEMLPPRAEGNESKREETPRGAPPGAEGKEPEGQEMRPGLEGNEPKWGGGTTRS